jgi:5-formyltetrahydrofolate cyclo-ligase
MPGDLKTAFRTRCAVRRSRISRAEHADAAGALVASLVPVLPASGPVAAYASVGTEPGTAGLLAALTGAGREVLLPLLLPDGDLDWARYDGRLLPGPRGVPHPAGPPLGRDAVADCALLVVPALAVDRSGTRLGRGGGAYDRALGRTSGHVVAALHRGELVDHLPAEPHDRPVHAAAVPGEGLVPLRAHPRAPTTGGAGGMAG